MGNQIEVEKNGGENTGVSADNRVGEIVREIEEKTFMLNNDFSEEKETAEVDDQDGENGEKMVPKEVDDQDGENGEERVSKEDEQDVKDAISKEKSQLRKSDDKIKNSDSLKNLRSDTIKTIRRKTSDFVAPQNIEITNYCRALINVSFHGQVTLKAQLELYHLMEENSSFTLAALLQSMHQFLRSFSSCEELTGEEEEFIFYIQGLMERRNHENMEKFWKDAWKFVEIYRKRGFSSEDLNHANYWGTRQQLLAGKVIGDFIDKEYGALDPVFGILLCPVAGRAGPGDSGIVHEILFDDDGPLAYHSAAHDAFGYLLTYHNVGPGYNYLGADCELLKASRCMSGQISGIYFWREILKTEKSDKLYSVA